ncbi:hypothetical protein SORBI_3004G355101 [Sorghum bicolor]|uniref:Uncharacterized protein n=1 Tax=Sorghum bicolor TaxID=4558 RepID=A0A1Z5RQQ2_SORBI|nr:hypothetical protein SORBI_3004G355101 [Sorghum bicolor]
MVWLQYTATRSQRAATACFFLTGAALIIIAAAKLSYANIEPQRVLEAFINRKLGGGGGRGSDPEPLHQRCQLSGRPRSGVYARNQVSGNKR